PNAGYIGGVGANARLNNAVGIGTNGDTLFFTEDHGIRLLYSHSLEAHYPLSGNLVNYILDGTTLTLDSGMESYSVGRFNEANGSLAFNGATSYSATLNGNYQQVSLAGWVRWDGSAGGLQLLFHLGADPTDEGLGLYLKGTGADPDSNKLHIRYGNEPAKPVNHFKMRANEWIHLAITRGNAINPAKVYANGKLIYSETIVTGTAGGGVNFRLGGNGLAGGSEFFTGNIADVRQYQRVLNEGEINELAKDATQSLVGHTYNTNGAVGLVAHYDFNTATGQLDKGPNSYSAPGGPDVARGLDGKNDSARKTNTNHYQTAFPVYGLPNGSAPRTICSWVKPDRLPNPGTNQVIVSYGINADYYGLSIRNNAGNHSIVALNSGGNQEANYTLPLNTWTHVCTVFNGTNTIFYAMGNQLTVGIPITVNTNLTTGSTLVIGANHSIAERFTGKLDDIRIYNRALTGIEIRRLGAQNYNGLVARFDFTGDNQDVSGFGTILSNSGTAPTLSIDRFGNSGSAYLFNGGGNFRTVTGPSNPYFPLPRGTEPVTICAWVRADQLSGGVRSAVGYGTTTSLENIWLGVRNLDAANPTPETCSLSIACSTPPRFSPYVWGHLCVAQSETNANLYFNGRQIFSQGSGTWNKQANDLMIGALNNNYRFPGNIDEVIIYNRELIADEIRALSGYHLYQTVAWSTITLSNQLRLHLQVDSLSELNESNPVMEWQDSSGFGNHVAPPGNPPSYEKAGLMGKPTVLFESGDGNFLRNDTVNGFSTGSLTTFYVLERISNVNTDTILSFGPNPDGFRSFFGNGADTIYIFKTGYPLHLLISNNIFVPNTPHLISKVFGGGTRQVFDKGLNQTSATNSATFDATGPLEIGALVGGTETFGGRISEILYFNNTLSPADRFRVECYLSAKYGIALDASLNCD
ncbi:MAG: laminin G domain-containing protein, partial [Leptospira sp.]|nr:laminin G domain-containing protein [Leptospira sp.]